VLPYENPALDEPANGMPLSGLDVPQYNAQRDQLAYHEYTPSLFSRRARVESMRTPAMIPGTRRAPHACMRAAC
jgi:hypothetical protein